MKYAAMLIKSRLIDYHRKEQRHRGVISLDTPVLDGDAPLGNTIADERDRCDELETRDATRAEIEELSAQMKDFGVSLTDVAENCPKQRRTLEACRRALQYAYENPDILDELLKMRRLPISRLMQSGVERKTLERHRKYMVALLLIYTNGFEIIRGHLKQVMKGAAAK